MTQDEIDALPGELTLTFRAPIVFAGETYHEATLVEPTAQQLEQIERQSGAAAICTAVALCGGVPLGVAKQLKSRDLRRAESFFSGFLQPAQPMASPD